MSRDGITLSYKQIGGIALILINLVIVGPGGWMLKTLWSEARDFETDTEEQFEKVKTELGDIRIDVSSNYVTRQAFSTYREQMGETIRHLDSKVSAGN